MRSVTALSSAFRFRCANARRTGPHASSTPGVRTPNDSGSHTTSSMSCRRSGTTHRMLRSSSATASGSNLIRRSFLPVARSSRRRAWRWRTHWRLSGSSTAWSKDMPGLHHSQGTRGPNDAPAMTTAPCCPCLRCALMPRERHGSARHMQRREASPTAPGTQSSSLNLSHS